MVKVIFLENVENNPVGTIKNVPDGYARNFLFPRNLALPATEEEIKKVEERLEKIKQEEEKKVKQLEKVSKDLASITLTFEKESSEEGKLFGSVTNAEIAEELAKKGFEVEKQDIETIEPIKTEGDHEVTVKLGHSVEQTIKIVVKRAKTKE